MLPQLSHRAGPEVHAALQSQWLAIRRTEAAERTLRAQAEEQRRRIDSLRADGRRLAGFLPALRVARAMREARARRRGDAIRAYVADHALDARSRLDMAAFRLDAARAGVARGEARIAALEDEVRRLCACGGVRDAGHAYAVLMGEEDGDKDEEGEEEKEKEERGEDGRGLSGDGGGGDIGTVVGGDLNVGVVNVGVDANGYGYGGYGLGYGYPGADGHQNPGPLGPWSPSSLGRAEEEYDRFLAEMHMREAQGAASDTELEGRCSDDESLDSGVAGLRNRSPFQGPDGMWYMV